MTRRMVPLFDRSKGACVGVDPDLFFPAQGESTAKAKAVCARCPIRAACAEWAITAPEKFGIWGRLSERERRVERKRRGLRDDE